MHFKTPSNEPLADCVPYCIAASERERRGWRKGIGVEIAAIGERQDGRCGPLLKDLGAAGDDGQEIIVQGEQKPSAQIGSDVRGGELEKGFKGCSVVHGGGVWWVAAAVALDGDCSLGPRSTEDGGSGRYVKD